MLQIFIAIILATAGQILLSSHDLRGLIFSAFAILVLLFGLWQDEKRGKATENRMMAVHNSQASTVALSQPWYRRFLLGLLLALATANAVLAFLAAHHNTYRWYGVVTWLLAICLFLAVFWKRGPNRTFRHKLGLNRETWRASLAIIVILGLVLIGFLFRFWRLDQMPSEMTSDHIEKLLDVHDLVTGQRPIFFIRNTGREPWQFYWTLMFIRTFNLDTKFLALKLGTATIGFITLPGVYLLGRDLFGRWVGLWAMLFTAVASWPVILSRVGLRFALAPAATAWSLFFLLRGLRYGRRNDFLLLGLCLGIGLQGYTAFRAMPLAVVVCWAAALIFRPATLALRPRKLVRNALMTVLIAVIVFIPLGRYSLERPDDFWRRSASRLADPNQPIPEGPFLTFTQNLKDLALMFHWKGDDVWVNTLADAPILDPLLGGLLILGLVIVLWRGLCLRDPIPPLLLAAGLILLLPSALSLAYPIENPSAVRSGGAIPAVMVIAAMPVSLALERGSPTQRSDQRWDHSILRSVEGLAKRIWRHGLPTVGILTLAIAVTVINYRRYFVDYWKQYQQNALNTTEIARAIQDFIKSGGDPANAWIIAWPYWIDTRGVGIELGDAPWNNVILEPEEIDDHVNTSAEEGESSGFEEGPRLYVLHPFDGKSLEQLRSLYPDGWSKLYISKHPDRSFVLFFVPSPPSQAALWDSKGMNIYAP